MKLLAIVHGCGKDWRVNTANGGCLTTGFQLHYHSFTNGSHPGHQSGECCSQTLAPGERVILHRLGIRGDNEGDRLDHTLVYDAGEQAPQSALIPTPARSRS